MKKMIYKSKRKVELLHSGEYKGYKFAIVNLGTHPTAYVENKNDFMDYEEANKSTNYTAHGGFTYFGNAYWNEKDTAEYLGWDYAHMDDYSGVDIILPEHLRSYGKQWTTEEIFEEVKNVITILKKEN